MVTVLDVGLGSDALTVDIETLDQPGEAIYSRAKADRER
jgi:hypothetical protein